MKTQDVKAIRDTGQQIGAVLINRGGWQGGENHIVTLALAWADDPEMWAMAISNLDGVLLREIFVEAENIVAITTRLNVKEFPDAT